MTPREDTFKWNAWFKGLKLPVVIEAPNIDAAYSKALGYASANGLFFNRVIAQDPYLVITARV